MRRHKASNRILPMLLLVFDFGFEKEKEGNLSDNQMELERKWELNRIGSEEEMKKNYGQEKGVILFLLHYSKSLFVLSLFGTVIMMICDYFRNRRRRE